MKTKKYLKQWVMGSFFSEDFTKELDETRSIKDQLSERAFSYQTFERSVVESDGETLLGKEKNHSATHYIGEEFTDKEAIAHHECNHIMKSNIEGNNWKRLIRTNSGRWFNIQDQDIVEAK